MGALSHSFRWSLLACTLTSLVVLIPSFTIQIRTDDAPSPSTTRLVCHHPIQSTCGQTILIFSSSAPVSQAVLFFLPFLCAPPLQPGNQKNNRPIVLPLVKPHLPHRSFDCIRLATCRSQFQISPTATAFATIWHSPSFVPFASVWIPSLRRFNPTRSDPMHATNCYFLQLTDTVITYLRSQLVCHSTVILTDHCHVFSSTGP